MRKFTLFLAVLCAAMMPLAGSAQMSGDKSGAAPAPKVLHIGREDIKPGKGFAHFKNEAAWTQALIKAKYAPTILAAESVTGPSEVLWFTGFESFAAYEADYKSNNTPSGVESINAQFGPAESDFVSSTNDMVARFREDLSYGPPINIGEYHYFAIRTTRVKIGHGQEFEELLKTLNEARKSVNTNIGMATYQVTSGAPIGTYLTIIARKSLAELDDKMPDLPSDAMQRINELAEKSVANASDAIYAFNPRMSKVDDRIAKGDPTFWRPKVAMAKATAPADAAPAAPKPAATKNKP